MDNNKDYILNIRVSKDTLSKLKSKAKENSQSMSDLVRKTLDDSWEIFGDLKNDILGKENENTRGVEYFQKVIMAKDSECSRCGAKIPKGNPAYLGETKNGSKKYFCNVCFIDS